MISRTRPEFWRLFANLDRQTQATARATYDRFLSDPAHPSLRFKKLTGVPGAWSVRIGKQYRAVGERHGDKIYWFWIGTHNDFDNLFS